VNTESAADRKNECSYGDRDTLTNQSTEGILRASVNKAINLRKWTCGNGDRSVVRRS
jgi:hypothetical protein